ncbi:MAG: hypothetical protein FVQ85_06005 [Planctomycetes bacterium]|nr:hypothetical protein [Planctomycetota bacterium]
MILTKFQREYMNVHTRDFLFMKKIISVLSIAIFVVPVLARQDKPKVQLIERDSKIDVMISGKLFTSYVYGSELTKPVLVPVRTPSGIEVNRRRLLTEAEGASTDHPHHVGIFFAVDKVNGTKFWNNTAPPPQIKHIKITELASGTGKGKLSTIMHWIDNDGRVVLEEKRSMIFLADEYENEYAIDFSMDLTAKDTKVVFDDIEEGMFAIRVSDYLRQGSVKIDSKSGLPMPKESVDGTGTYFSSNGDETAKNIWGKRARWVALQGARKGKIVGVAILNHPASINYPTYWHVRNYGLFSANPLGQGDFQRQRPRQYRKNKVIPLRLTLEPGETAHFRFLVIVYDRVRTNHQIEKRFGEFVKK